MRMKSAPVLPGKPPDCHPGPAHRLLTNPNPRGWAVVQLHFWGKLSIRQGLGWSLLFVPITGCGFPFPTTIALNLLYFCVAYLKGSCWSHLALPGLGSTTPAFFSLANGQKRGKEALTMTYLVELQENCTGLGVLFVDSSQRIHLRVNLRLFLNEGGHVDT